jgi:RNA polymerase sigma factor (sigma-70 family)
MNKEYRVKIGVRNNLILAAIEEMGFRSVAAFCRQYGLVDTSVNQLICFRKAPITTDGEFCKQAKDLMEALGACPSDLWTDAQLTMCLENSTRETVMSESNLRFLLEEHNERMLLPDPADVLEQSQTSAMVADLLSTIRPREEKVLRMRFGIGTNEKTFEQVGNVLDVGKERVRQIEAKAMRKLLHPSRKEIIDGKKTGKQFIKEAP